MLSWNRRVGQRDVVEGASDWTDLAWAAPVNSRVRIDVWRRIGQGGAASSQRRV